MEIFHLETWNSMLRKWERDYKCDTVAGCIKVRENKRSKWEEQPCGKMSYRIVKETVVWQDGEEFPSR